MKIRCSDHLRILSIGYYDHVSHLHKEGKHREAINCAKKLMLLEEFKTNIIPGRKLHSAPYSSLAILYRYTQDPSAELAIFERYISLAFRSGGVKEHLINRYLKLAEKEHHPIPSDVKNVIEKNYES